MDSRTGPITLGIPERGPRISKLPSEILMDAQKTPLHCRSPSLKRLTRSFKTKSKSSQFLNTVMKQIFLRRLDHTMKDKLYKLRRQAGTGDLKYLSPMQLKIVGDKACGEFSKKIELTNNLSQASGGSKGRGIRMSVLNMIYKMDLKLRSFMLINSKPGRLTNAVEKLKAAKAKLLSRLPEVRVVRPNDPIVLLCDFINFFCSILMILIVTLSISFGIPASDVISFNSKSAEGKAIIFLSIFLFLGLLSSLTEVLLGFLTGFYRNGELISSKQLIRAHYIRSSLLLDVLTLYPFFAASLIYVAGAEWRARIDSLLIIMKLKSILKFIKKIEELISLHENAEAWFSLVKLSASVLLISHGFACIWCIIPDVTSPVENNWLNNVGLNNSTDPWSKIYLKALYWALTTVVTLGYGDVIPKNDLETVFTMFVMLSGSAIVGYSINKIGHIVENLNMRQRSLIKNIKLVSRYLKTKGLSLDLQTRVCKYIENSFNEETRPGILAEQILRARLNQSLTNELNNECYSSILENIAVLRKNFSKETLKKLTNFIEIVHFRPGELVSKLNQPEKNSLYIVSEGHLRIDMESASTQSLSLKKGDHFGEYSLFSGMPQQLSLRSVDYSTLLELKRENFMKVLRDKQMEYEKFCEIRDRVLTGHLKVLSEKCISCGECSHQLLKCPYVNLLPSSHLVILKYQHCPLQKRRHKYERKKKKNLHHALFHYNQIFENWNEIRLSDLFMDFYGGDSSVLSENQEEEEYDDASFPRKDPSKSVMDELEDEESNFKCQVPFTDAGAMTRINPNTIDEKLPLPLTIEIRSSRLDIKASQIENRTVTSPTNQMINVGQANSFVFSKHSPNEQRRFSFENTSSSPQKVAESSPIHKGYSSRGENMSFNGTVLSQEKRQRAHHLSSKTEKVQFNDNNTRTDKEPTSTYKSSSPREKGDQITQNDQEQRKYLFLNDMDVMMVNATSSYFPEHSIEQIMYKMRGNRSPYRKRKDFCMSPTKN